MIHGHGEVGDGGLDVVYGGDHFGIVVSLGLGLRNLMRAMHVCTYILYISFSMERRQAYYDQPFCPQIPSSIRFCLIILPHQ